MTFQLISLLRGIKLIKALRKLINLFLNFCDLSHDNLIAVILCLPGHLQLLLVYLVLQSLVLFVKLLFKLLPLKFKLFLKLLLLLF